jgi:MoaA/NifB/PqqE/SkfB family radical SAM enzyme
VRSLDIRLFESVVSQAMHLWPAVRVSLTGGEPLLHPEFSRVVWSLAERGVPYRFVTNGWHLRRVLTLLEQFPPESVRLSLSGATADTHDAHRGPGSFRRVMLGVALLTSRQIPSSLSMVIDRGDRHQLRDAADLAEALGCQRIHFILPQPVPGSARCDRDLPPEEWLPVRHEVEAIAALPNRRTAVALDYGAPFDGPETPCDTFALKRFYVDARGRLCTCCQLSQYGFNESEVVADLSVESLGEALEKYVARLAELKHCAQPSAASNEAVRAFPCLRCARASGKLDWLRDYPQSAWYPAAIDPVVAEVAV